MKSEGLREGIADMSANLAIQMEEAQATLIVGNCVDVMRTWPDNMIQLTVTSPPYDSLRNYKGYDFPFEDIADQLYRVTSPGGVVVWVVGDRINGGRTSNLVSDKPFIFKTLASPPTTS